MKINTVGNIKINIFSRMNDDASNYYLKQQNSIFKHEIARLFHSNQLGKDIKGSKHEFAESVGGRIVIWFLINIRRKSHSIL